jgi:hypothetical protein
MSISEAVPEMELSSAQAEDVSVPPSLSAANSPSGPVVALADVQLDNGRVEVESTVGGTLTCSICMLGSKSHQYACEDCAAQNTDEVVPGLPHPGGAVGEGPCCVIQRGGGESGAPARARTKEGAIRSDYDP